MAPRLNLPDAFRNDLECLLGQIQGDFQIQLHSSFVIRQGLKRE